MSDIIQLLPDSIANQIAAGEVIQRPASVVKELIENAIDAKADKIQLILRAAGKNMIQVVDNGVGMSDTDARMSFERHATSKLRTADDLFAIRTMGFRGEALASIAAVAQVTLKTKRENSEIGSEIRVEGSKVISQEVIACDKGTSVQVRNLFYNVPARRNFLKSDQVEMRHIMDEFQRTALAHPEISFECYHDDNLLYQVFPGNTRQRIIGLFGKQFDERIIPVEEKTTIIQIRGFTGKPEFARRTRGEQFFFVNSRFIKDGYLHHAVKTAYDELLPENTYPSYFLYFDIDPAQIDVNVHPTKTEIKFQDEKSIYAIVRASVKLALGKHSITPSIDFDVEPSFEVPYNRLKDIPAQPQIRVNTNYNPFQEEDKESKHNYSIDQSVSIPVETSSLTIADCFQIRNSFICCKIQDQIVVIDQQRAHERIIFDQTLSYIRNTNGPSQQSLFPIQIRFSASDHEIIKEIKPLLKSIGFDLGEFGSETIVVHGTPVWLEQGDIKDLLDHLIEQIKMNSASFKIDQLEFFAKAIARKASIKRGRKLSVEESVSLVSELLLCENPNADASGKVIMFKMDERFLNAQFDLKGVMKQL